MPRLTTCHHPSVTMAETPAGTTDPVEANAGNVDNAGNGAVAEPPSYLRAALPETDFAQQPRHIQLLVVFLFPLYGAARLTLTIIEESVKGSIKLAKQVGRTCAKVYAVCAHVYACLAPRVYRFLLICFIRPINRYIVSPIFTVVKAIFDSVAWVIVEVGRGLYHTGRLVARAFSKIFP